MKKALYILLISGVAAFTGCGLVDEDLSDCETDFDLDYQMNLVVRMDAQLSAELNLDSDAPVRSALEGYFGNIFREYASDVDLNFYDTEKDPAWDDALRLHHEAHTMDAKQTRYTLFIAKRHYMHLAIANVAQSGSVRLENSTLCHAARLSLPVKDTLESQRTGLFTARFPMHVKEGESQHFEVKLYMSNCASSVVLDTLGSHIRALRVLASGFATGFNICDSTYLFPYSPLVRPDKIEIPGSTDLCYAAVTFPSRETPDTKTAGEEPSPWRYYVYATLPDGSVTETRLVLHKPLKAGQIKIIRGKVLENGATQPGDPTVGVSITTDWKPGSEYEVEF